MTRFAIVCLLLPLSYGCGPHTDPAPATTAPPPDVATTVARPAVCRVMETFALPSPTSAARLLALDLNDEGGLLLAVDATGQTSTLPLNVDGHERGRLTEVELPQARGLLAFSPLGAGFVAISEGSCAAGSHCLHALQLNRDGMPRGDVLITSLPSEPLTLRRTTLGGRLLLAISTRHAAPRLFTYASTALGLSVDERTLAQGPWPEEADATILTLTTDETRWAALYRVGPTEAPTSHVVLALQDGEHDVPTLEHALAVDASIFERDGLTLLVSYEFFRPKVHRLHFDGSAHVAARELLPGASLPSAFRGMRRGSLEHGARLQFILRTAAGDQVEPPLTLADHGRIAADVARAGDQYFVATANGGRVAMMRLRCDLENTP